MPIGHALMVLNEILLQDSKLVGAGIIGVLGTVLLIIGIRKNKNRAVASILGLLAGILIWTGWVEFSFVWIAEKLNVAPYMENGEVATKPEYLVMLSSIGLLGALALFYTFSRTHCTLIVWFQKTFRFKDQLVQKEFIEKPLAIVSFMETIIIIWAFYILLLLVYDPDLFGDKHPVTYIVAYGSLIWSALLIANLLKIQKFDYAIRYAIPTVVIFWNFIEVLGRWGWFKEIWVYPKEHWIEIAVMTLAFIGFLIYFFTQNKTKITY
ncbi:MAG: hypothetical protein ACJAQR_001751 [Bacteroidia bacterium]|jgi:hypothetical protein